MAEQDWGNLPQHILLQIFQQSSLDTIGSSAQVCHSWNAATYAPSLLRSIKLVLNDRQLEETARRSIALAKRCAEKVTELRVVCSYGSNENDTMKLLNVFLTIFSSSKLRVFKLQGIYQNSSTNTAMMRFASGMNKFLKQQKNLEKFSIKETLIEVKMVNEFLRILSTPSGDNLKTICLNLCHVDGWKLALGQIHAFDTILTNFRNIQRLDIRYINQQLIENLSKSLGTNFKQFVITVHEGLEERISDWAWMALRISCPDLGVTLNVIDNLDDVVLLTPNIPLVSITVLHKWSVSHQFGMANIAKLFKHSLEELYIDLGGIYVEPDQYDIFFTHLASFQRLRTFSTSMYIITERNIKFLRAFGDMLKRPNSLRDVTFKYQDSRTIGSKVLKEIDKLKEESVDSGLLLKFDLPVPGQDYND